MTMAESVKQSPIRGAMRMDFNMRYS